jgi:RHS repeat-associated protein
MPYPRGRVVTNGYDGANRIQSVTGAFNGSRTYVSNATYAAWGAIAGFNYGSGRTRTFSYNGRMQLGEMSDLGAAPFDLKYYYGGAATSGAAGASTAANNGNPTAVVEKALKGSGPQYTFTQTYGYDKANRLNAASDTGGWTQNFNYDQYGNPWTTANAGLPPDRLPTSNVYTATTNHSTYTGTAYDAGGVGNQVTMGATTLTFDAENRIVQVYNSVTVNSTCYGYDGLGQRVYKQTFGGNTCTGTAATTILYTYDAFGNLAAEHPSGTGTLTFPPCVTCYLTWDHLGSVRMVSDTLAGGYTGFHDYAPFGEEVLVNSGRGPDWGTSGNGTDYLNQRYTGAERDTESSLDFLQARYLANQQGRFVSADPAGNFVADPGSPQSWNLYSYAWSNPLQYFDPSGLACIYSGSGDTGDPNNYYDDDTGAQSCADAFASPPEQVNVNDTYSWLDALSFSSWTSYGNTQVAGVGLLGTTGSNFLQNVTNIKLQNIISNLYRPGAQIASGSTMDAIRNEIATGLQTGGKWHSLKGFESRNGLLKLWRGGSLNATEQSIVKQLLIDLQDALSGINSELTAPFLVPGQAQLINFQICGATSCASQLQ